MKSVALIGGGTRSRDLAIIPDGAEIWSCNNLYTLCSVLGLTPTCWFEIHFIDRDAKGIYTRRNRPTIGASTDIRTYLTNLNKLKIPVYMQKHWPIIKRSVAYPLQPILQQFQRGYFNNSYAYMLALAIIEGYTSITITGMVQPNETFREYYVHRISTEYFLGYAEGLGIKVMVGHSSDLLRVPRLYGYQEQPGDYDAWHEIMQDDATTAYDVNRYWRI